MGLMLFNLLADAGEGAAEATEKAVETAQALFPNFGTFGLALGAGLITMGAAKGIGMIGSKAVESIARQPEARPGIFTSMIITAALIEGFTFFALVVLIIANGKL